MELAAFTVTNNGQQEAAMPRKQKSRAKRKGGRKTVGDVMVPGVITVEPSAPLTNAARIMDAENIGILPVVADGRVLGVITDRDIVVRAIARGADPPGTTVQECLTSRVHLAREDWTIDDAMKTMGEAQIGRLPVVGDGDRLVGIVTLSSMAFRAPQEGEALETAQEVSRRSARSVA
jgi:CBS domain-containing protein